MHATDLLRDINKLGINMFNVRRMLQIAFKQGKMKISEEDIINSMMKVKGKDVDKMYAILINMIRIKHPTLKTAARKLANNTPPAVVWNPGFLSGLLQQALRIANVNATGTFTTDVSLFLSHVHKTKVDVDDITRLGKGDHHLNLAQLLNKFLTEATLPKQDEAPCDVSDCMIDAEDDKNVGIRKEDITEETIVLKNDDVDSDGSQVEENAVQEIASSLSAASVTQLRSILTAKHGDGTGTVDACIRRFLQLCIDDTQTTCTIETPTDLIEDLLRQYNRPCYCDLNRGFFRLLKHHSEVLA